MLLPHGAEIFRRFAASAMAHSLSRVEEDPTLRAATAEISLHPGGKCSYHMHPAGTEGWEHSEQMVDRDGQLIYEVAVSVHYAMGSGTRGRSYLTSHGDVLTMSSITWYSNGSRWDLSPGYVPDDPRGFAGGCRTSAWLVMPAASQPSPAPVGGTRRSLFPN